MTDQTEKVKNVQNHVPDSNVILDKLFEGTSNPIKNPEKWVDYNMLTALQICKLGELSKNKQT